MEEEREKSRCGGVCTCGGKGLYCVVNAVNV